MSGATLSLLSGALALCAHAALVPVLLRVARRATPVNVHLGSAIAIHSAQVAILWRFAGDGFPYWHGAAVFGAGAIAYLFAFSAVYKSVSLRLLLVLLGADEPCVTFARLASEVVRPEFERRLALLVDMGLCVEKGDSFAPSDSGIAAASRIRAMQRLFGVENPGLY